LTSASEIKSVRRPFKSSNLWMTPKSGLTHNCCVASFVWELVLEILYREQLLIEEARMMWYDGGFWAYSVTQCDPQCESHLRSSIAEVCINHQSHSHIHHDKNDVDNKRLHLGWQTLHIPSKLWATMWLEFRSHCEGQV